uniref:Uncharacterized protein n=1 Tax=Anguilla anguilla TaxID=7936 RepID=A0A0E9TSC6_ANGAN
MSFKQQQKKRDRAKIRLLGDINNCKTANKVR